jgi:hypothetical protein
LQFAEKPVVEVPDAVAPGAEAHEQSCVKLFIFFAKISLFYKSLASLIFFLLSCHYNAYPSTLGFS